MEVKRVAQTVSPFSQLVSVSVQVMNSCNLACGYCYLDAELVDGGVLPSAAVPDPELLASRLATLLSFSTRPFHRIVISGGEPLLLSDDWFAAFFSVLDTFAADAKKQIHYTVQTNAACCCSPGLLSLFAVHKVHFSVHYDGARAAPALKTSARRAQIMALRKQNFPVSAIIVGTAEALIQVPETLEFFRQWGINSYRLNYLGKAGRGSTYPEPTVRDRVNAEFECAFAASQSNFAVQEKEILTKFFLYDSHVREGAPLPKGPRLIQCPAGVNDVTLLPDGGLYPCSFFPDITGPIAFLDQLPTLAGGHEAVACCRRSPQHDMAACRNCEAFVFCHEYCPLTPQAHLEFFCAVQRALKQNMDRYPQMVAMVASGFRAHLVAHRAEAKN